MNKKTLLYLIEKNQYINKLSRVRFNSLERLEDFFDIKYWGPGWVDYSLDKTIDENLKDNSLKIDYILCYKPELIIGINDIKIPKIITYNEMWDEEYTIKQINDYNCNLVICHHRNDLIKYSTSLFKKISSFCKLVDIPHCSERTIFFDRNLPKDIDILLVGSIGRHYPLRQRLKNIIKLFPSKYKCLEYQHPGYIHADAFTNRYLNEFAEIINRTKICITCSSKYKYRLGKIVEIPMCNTVLACDLPDQDQDELSEIMIVLNEKDSDQKIVNKIVEYLENNDKYEELRKHGYEWSQKYIQENYANKFYSNVLEINLKPKIFILADELTSLKTKWICDILKEEFINYSNLNIVSNPNEANIIWLLAPWATRKIDKKFLEEKYVITTIHHIDWEKYSENIDYYNYIDRITNKYHTICPKTELDLRKITKKKIVTACFWINENNFFRINNKNELREKYKIPVNSFVIGSFQKDTEGKDDSLPKLSKGPDIFIKIVADFKKTCPKEVFIVLTGWRRNYVIKELEKIGIRYVFYELVDLVELNELYNTLDLYLVSSRVEGGPRAIIECGLAKIPLISTDVGMSELILAPESIYNKDDYLTYKNAKPNIEFSYRKSKEYTIVNYMNKFCLKVFS